MPVKCLGGSTESPQLPPKRKLSGDRSSIDSSSIGEYHTTDTSSTPPKTTSYATKKHRTEDTTSAGSVDSDSDSDSNINTNDDQPVNVEPGNNEEAADTHIHEWVASRVEPEEVAAVGVQTEEFPLKTGKVSYAEVGVQADEFPTEYEIWNYLLVRSGLGTRLPLVKARRKHRQD